jgi:DNA-binding NarL/FixJ family response regulator
MKTHRIAYIDEQKKEIRKFQRKLEGTFDVVGMLPKEDLDDFVEDILKSGVSAVVVDHKLSEYRVDVTHPVRYDGVELVNTILEIRSEFPCFVLTSFDEEAIQESKDVNLIYPKDSLDMKVGETTFPEKVRVQIEHYQARLKNWSDEFDSLVKKAETKKLTEAEEQRLLELDSFLEAALNKKTSVAATSKQQSGMTKLSKLIKSTDQLIKELRKRK